jgi:hypothetical protein
METCLDKAEVDMESFIRLAPNAVSSSHNTPLKEIKPRGLFRARNL